MGAKHDIRKRFERRSTVPRAMRFAHLPNAQLHEWGGLTVTSASAAFERHHGQTSPAAENGANTMHNTRSTVAADILQSKGQDKREFTKVSPMMGISS